MRYAGLLKNDFVNGRGVCVSFWTQGCQHRCPGCHNPQTWDFYGGLEAQEDELIEEIIEALDANGVARNLSILGGEPLQNCNTPFVAKLIATVRKRITRPIKIFLWTGAELNELRQDIDGAVYYILHNVDVLITGRFIAAERDITLKWRGSRNQQIVEIIDFSKKI